jgi:hypothetical protein
MGSGKLLVDDLSVVYGAVAGAPNDLLGLPVSAPAAGVASFSAADANLLALPTGEAVFSSNQ